MADITENEIIEFLKERVIYHKSQTKWIEGVLSFITSKPLNLTHLIKDDNLSPIIRITSYRKGKTQIKKTVKFNKTLPVPEVYRPGLFMNRKIAYVLNLIQSGYKEEIAAQIITLQPDVNKTQIIKQLSTVLSKLKSQKLLIATKEGRKFRYSLPHE